MDYVLKGQELEYMTEELKVHRKDDEDKYQQEQEMKKLDIELKQTKLSVLNSEAEMLRLKIQLAELMKNSPAQSSPA